MTQFWIGLGLAGLITMIALAARVLKPSGAVGAVVIGTIIFGLGGLPWALPMVVFFFFSSMLAHIGREKKATFDQIFEKSSQRDLGQVMANGLIAALLVIFDRLVPGEINYAVYLGSLAAVSADTWATEMGTLFNHPPRHILNFNPVPAGTSGGITWPGSLGGLIGAALVALTGFYFLPKLLLVVVVIISGMLGNFIDSILGAMVQAQYQCPICQCRTERQIHCQQPTTLISGFAWVNNDWVNLACSFGGAVWAGLFYGITTSI